jgi:small subunit ribosomal protein S24e
VASGQAQPQELRLRLNIALIRDNRLLGRRELVVEILHARAPTPTRQTVREYVARQLGVSPSAVFIRRIKTEYGVGRSTAEIHVYDNPDIAKRMEPLYVIARNLGEEGKKLLEGVRKMREARREGRRKKRKERQK